MAGEDAGAPPDHLWVHQEGIYRDEYQRTWVAVVEEVSVCILLIFYRFCFEATWFLASLSILKPLLLFLIIFFPLGDEFPKGTSPASSGSLR